VIGGGNTAIDAATQARILGADVTILYRRGEAAMSATVKERQWAQVHGVAIRFYATPLRIEAADGALCVVTETERYAADTVLKAVGQRFGGLEGPVVEGGRIKVDGDYATSLPGVFAGGDCVAGMDLTVRAVRDGKLAARGIHAYLEVGK